MKFAWPMLLLALALPALCQPSNTDSLAARVMGGYLYQTAITPESYLITNAQDLKSFVTMIPPTTPYKNLPAPPNPDPFLKGFKVDFQQNVLIVAVGRDRIELPPVFQGSELFGDESRQVFFTLPTPKTKVYPFGYAVYTAVILPRIEGRTTVEVKTLAPERGTDTSRRKFQRL